MSEGGGWAVVLGASSGTGAAIAQAVARAPGLDVFGVHRGHHPDGAEAVALDLGALGRRLVMRVADAATAEGASDGAEAVHAACGPRAVKLFVHSIASASVGHLVAGGDPLHPRQVHKTFDAMAHSFVFWARQLHERDLLAPGALLLGLTNPLGDSLLHNTGLITAAKAALEIYVRQLAVELGPLGHRVNLLRFGTVRTRALDHVYAAPSLARLEEAHARMNPAGRMCTPAEVARFVTLLLDERAQWMTGATIDFTGGMMLKLIDLVLNGG